MSSHDMTISDSDDLEVVHSYLRARNYVPGWDRPERPFWSEPRGDFIPHVWKYRESKAALSAAGRLVDTELAERRNVVMVNPGEEIVYPSTRTHVLAYQSLLPGERARTHRHSPHAGRVALDCGEGVYTIVDGVRLDMSPNDVLLTPGGSWHGHGNEGDDPAFWLDFLDVPLVQFLDPMFFSLFPGGFQEPERTEGDESALYFGWDDTVRRLGDAEPNAAQGRVIALGEPALPTIGLNVHQFDGGVTSELFQTTANREYVVLEGHGSSTIGEAELEWERGDTFVAPCWRPQEHHAEIDSVLLCVTDEPLQRYCGYLRTADGSGSTHW
ncbi:MAG: gentisate 1,2-dioxygenase [Thermoleophilaceae bacterium]|nr:gentisate 1,2-dioxygenase [Thermoleophilaceae bacterium]MEA2453779.1 gentisate 1,2-dioxygenase [Thermoleophilaceae bacterium]